MLRELHIRNGARYGVKADSSGSLSVSMDMLQSVASERRYMYIKSISVQRIIALSWVSCRPCMHVYPFSRPVSPVDLCSECIHSQRRSFCGVAPMQYAGHVVHLSVWPRTNPLRQLPSPTPGIRSWFLSLFKYVSFPPAPLREPSPSQSSRQSLHPPCPPPLHCHPV